MQEATLCFPVEDDRVLLIHKKRGLGAGLYNGPGGKVEPGESPRECARREVAEEVGLTVREAEKCGELDFVFGGEPFMFVHAYRATAFAGTPEETAEADPEWFPVDEVPFDEMWPDDRHWLPLLLDGVRFRGRFWFDEDGDELRDWELQRGADLRGGRPGTGL